MAYRRAIYAELDQSARAQLWSEHFAQYRLAHPNLSAKQQKILGHLEALAKDTSVFGKSSTRTEKDDETLKQEAIEAFGRDEAGALLATLGPVEPTSQAQALLVDCECSVQSNWCGVIWPCSALPSCTASWSGCGTLYRYPCDGMCT
ncbi:bacteriocin fulvocin C-related protein [Nonomuraea glycinis]|nr:bacteriocin fulvocin C-related protein [Nonomuraea glycinis]